MFPLRDNIATDRFPLVTLLLLVANVVVYFFFQKGGILHGPSDEQILRYGAIPYEFSHPGKQCEFVHDVSQIVCEGQRGVAGSAVSQPTTAITLLSSMFMHGSFFHLLGNMLFLWIFGNNVEDSMGKVRFLCFYLLAGVAALALQIVIDPNTVAPTIGASGAVAGVLGGYILLYPRARVLTLIIIIFFVTIVEIPALILLGVWFAQQVLLGYADMTGPEQAGGVAYFAHIGGFIFGALLIKLFANQIKKIPERPVLQWRD